MIDCGFGRSSDLFLLHLAAFPWCVHATVTRLASGCISLELTAAGLSRILTWFPLGPLSGEPKPVAKIRNKNDLERKIKKKAPTVKKWELINYV